MTIKKKQLNVGDVIRVINDTDYDDVQTGDIGTIIQIGTTRQKQYQIKLATKSNAYSRLGYYYFTIDDIEFNSVQDVNSCYPTTLSAKCIDTLDADIKQLLNARYGKGANMKNKQLLKGYKKALVRFRDPVRNDYNDVWYALYDNNVEAGDMVLCATGHHGQVIAEVYDIPTAKHAKDIEIEYGREIICKIDYTDFNERQRKLERIVELKKTMTKKKAELDELAVYELLAKQSPEMADMLKELKELL